MLGPGAVIPRHVAACQWSEDCRERWFIWLWSRSNPEKQTRIPYSCNSWRCAVCRRHEASVTFARLKQAYEGWPAEPGVEDAATGEIIGGREAREALDPRGWCMLVLTLDRDGYYSGKPWLDVNAAYAALGQMSRATLSRIGREWGSETREEVREKTSKKTGKKTVSIRYVRCVGNSWVAVVEAHRSGWPHMNLMVWCPELAAELERDHNERLEDEEVANAVALARDAWKAKEPVPDAVRAVARRATLVGGRLGEIIAESGWGPESTAERARDIDAVMAYGVKLAGLHDASVGELAKVTQCPMNAPVKFRRLRTGKGFLPPRESNPDVTGVLIKRVRSAEGDWEIKPINAPKDECLIEPIERARGAELQLIAEEEAILSRNHGRLPAMPPMRIALRGQLEGHKHTSQRRAAIAAAVHQRAG